MAEVVTYAKRVAGILNATWFRVWVGLLVVLTVAGFILAQLGNEHYAGATHPDIMAAMGGILGAMALFYLGLLIPFILISAYIRIRTEQTNYEW